MITHSDAESVGSVVTSFLQKTSDFSPELVESHKSYMKPNLSDGILS